MKREALQRAATSSASRPPARCAPSPERSPSLPIRPALPATIRLAERLRQAAGQAELPATLTLRDAAFNEGPAGVANAVKKLWSNIGSYLAAAVAYLFTAGRVTLESKPVRRSRAGT